MTGRMIGAIRSVIGSRQIPTVAGFCVVLSNAEGYFEVREYGILLGPSRTRRRLVDLSSVNELHIIEANAYTYSCFVGGPENKYHGLAFHFARGSVTYMFHGPLWKPLPNAVAIAGTAEQFLAQTREQYGLQWIGGLMVRDPIDEGAGPSAP